MPIAEIIAQATERRPLGDRIDVAYEARLYRLDGNDRPYFSLTGTEWERGREVAGGAMHERVVEVWPELAPLAVIHLSDDRGVPMHAAANMAYWLGFAPSYGGTSYGPTPPDLDVAGRHWRIGRDEARALQRTVEAQAPAEQPARYEFAVARLAEVAEQEMAARWQAEADAALALIRALAEKG